MKSRRSAAKHYFTTGRKTDGSRAEDVDWFKLPSEDVGREDFIERFWEERREERRRERSSGYLNSHNYRSRLRLNLPERLFVPDPEKLPGRSITEDVDRDFYTLVEGRRIKLKKNLRDYASDLRKCFFTRLKIGYCNDEILKAEERHAREVEKFGDIKRKFELYLNCFEDFLKTDHNSSAELLRIADAERTKSADMGRCIAELSSELRRLEAEVLVVEEVWSNYRNYQRFLYEISPSEWRREHDRDFGSESRPAKSDDEEDLYAKIRKFEEDTSGGDRAPALYFRHPEQVQHIFRELEKNNVLALIHCNNLERPIQAMLSALKRVKTEFAVSQERLEDEVAFMRNLVREEEGKAAAARDKAREIVFGMYKDYVITEENLIVTALLEDAYEDIIAVNDYDLDMVTMVKEIELRYESLLLTLDKHPHYVLVPAMKAFYRGLKRSEKEAAEAARKVRLMEILTKRLRRSLTYPKKDGPQRTVTRKLVHRSEPRKESLKKLGHQRILTQDEKDREYFFGLTCRHVGEAGLYRSLCSASKNLFPGLE